MTYSESAKGQRITWERALQELDAHGVLSDVELFRAECWNKSARKGLISAYTVLMWLGY